MKPPSKKSSSEEISQSRLLHREMDPAYRRELSKVFAEPAQKAARKDFSGLLIRCESEWLVIPAHMLSEIGDFGTIHPIPFRRNPAVAGLVNVRGRLTVAVYLQILIGVSTSVPEAKPAMVVFGLAKHRTVLLVSALGKIVFWNEQAIEPIPATLAKASKKFCRGILRTDEGAMAGLLDEDLLDNTIDWSLG